MPEISHKPRFFSTPAAFRRWLKENHNRSDELWVGFHKRSTGRKSITWAESVDQALCFGWIDGVRKSLGDQSYAIRFTRRRPGSIWSVVNSRRANELLERGLMATPGKDAFAKRKKVNRYSFEQRKAVLPLRYERTLRRNTMAWKHFQSLPPSIRKQCIWWIISAKREETQQRRLAILITSSAMGMVIPPLRFGKK